MPLVFPFLLPCTQTCVTGRYLPDCEALASDQRAREGAACVLRRAQLEAMRHLRLAETSFQPYSPSDAAAASPTRMPAADAGAARGDQQGDDALDADDDDLVCSDDEFCEAVDLADSGSSDDSEDDC